MESGSLFPPPLLVKIGLLGIVVWAAIALFGLYHARYMLAGTALVFLSFSIYVWESHRD